MLNADGSQRTTLPPFLSPQERALKEAADRRATTERIAQQDAIRRDRTLVQRYPTEAAHQRARNLRRWTTPTRPPASPSAASRT